MKWLLCFLALLIVAPLTSQTAASNQGLTLDTIGHGTWKPHRTFGFRVYSTPDGTKADVKYLTFSTRGEAKQYIKTCLRPGAKVIYRRQKKDSNGQIVGERIVAVAGDSERKEFALIRGVGLNYYFIGSSSLAAAIQVEELIDER